MDLEHLRHELSKLPPAEAAKLLRELLDRTPVPYSDADAWDRAADEVIHQYREALERLAK